MIKYIIPTYLYPPKYIYTITLYEFNDSMILFHYGYHISFFNNNFTTNYIYLIIKTNHQLYIIVIMLLDNWVRF